MSSSSQRRRSLLDRFVVPVILLLVVATVGVVWWGYWEEEQDRQRIMAMLHDPFAEEDIQVDLDQFEPIPVVPEMAPHTELPIKTVKESWDTLEDHELVLGVTIHGESRAYPINMMTGPDREIFNDTLGGTPIAATW